ncbi:M48 family metalloprotease [Hirschia maritima]|uniref:M48 family metalloprotease n=1 Tax=Hirschia maritima TaxID=1121961 RepID=UPI0003A6CC3A|nr:M48 family metalloprotease [Hirschia maritima]
MDVLKRLPRALALASALIITPVVSAQAQGFGLIRDAEIETTLQDYGRPLFEAGGLNPNEVDIFIVNDNRLNAFVTGGQNMFFNTGTLIKADSPQEILGVMAHEAGHIIGGHNITRTQAMGSAAGTSWIALGLGVLAIAAGAPDAGAMLMASSQHAAALTFFKYTRVEESSADQTGLRLLEQTGIPADGLVSFMEKIRVSEVLSTQRQDPYYRTHPETGPRIGALRHRAKSITENAEPLPPIYQKQLEMMQAKLVGFLQPRATYTKYPMSDMSTPARYARAIAAHRNNDETAALKDIAALIEIEPDNPYFEELYGQILYENGKFEESIPHHRRALELSTKHSLLYVNLAQSLIALKTKEANEEAEELLHMALIREPGNGYAWHQMSFALGALGRQAEAELATAESAYAIGDYPRANVFANRAREDLEQNTPKWRRADDIAAITQVQMRNNGVRGQRRRINGDFTARIHGHVNAH